MKVLQQGKLIHEAQTKNLFSLSFVCFVTLFRMSVEILW